VRKKIEAVVAEIRREFDAGTLSRRRLTFNYVVHTRGKVTASTVKESYHKASADLVNGLLEEVNGEAGNAPKAPRRPKPRQATYSDRLADLAREIEIARYLKRTEVAAAEEHAHVLQRELDRVGQEVESLRLERDRLKGEVDRFRPLSMARRPATTARKNPARHVAR
jgi:hypothetical protein